MRTTVDQAMERLTLARPFSSNSAEDVLTPSEENELLAWILSDNAVVVSMSPSARQHRRAAVLVIALVAAMAVALVVYVSVPSPTVRGKSGAVTLSGQWRLAGYYQAPGWAETGLGGPAGPMTCPSATACYLVNSEPTFNQPGQPQVTLNTLSVSHDEGATWSNLPIKGVSSFTTALQCPDSDGQVCLAGGMRGATPVLLRPRMAGNLGPLPTCPKMRVTFQISPALGESLRGGIYRQSEHLQHGGER